MTTFNYTNILTQAVDELSESQSYKGLFHQHKDGDPLPSAKSLYKIVELARAIIFPGYFGNSTVNSHTINYHIGVNVETLFGLLTDRKSTRLNSSHVSISYAVFCLKKKTLITTHLE